MTQLEKQLLHIVSEIDRRNVLSASTDPMQLEIHKLLQKVLGQEYSSLTVKELKDKINNL